MRTTPAATKVNSGATDPRCFPDPVQRAVGYLSSFQFLGWGPSVGDQVPRKVKTPKETNLGREGRLQAPQKVHRGSHLVLPLCLNLVWGCHTESPANSLVCVSRVSLQMTAVSGSTDNHFWGWCPLNLEKPRQCGRPEGHPQSEPHQKSLPLQRRQRVFETLHRRRQYQLK